MRLHRVTSCATQGNLPSCSLHILYMLSNVGVAVIANELNVEVLPRSWTENVLVQMG